MIALEVYLNTRRCEKSASEFLATIPKYSAESIVVRVSDLMRQTRRECDIGSARERHSKHVGVWRPKRACTEKSWVEEKLSEDLQKSSLTDAIWQRETITAYLNKWRKEIVDKRLKCVEIGNGKAKRTETLLDWERTVLTLYHPIVCTGSVGEVIRQLT